MTLPILGRNGRLRLGRLFILIAGLLLILSGSWLTLGLTPARPGSTEARIIEIPYGSGIGQVAGLLARGGLVRNQVAFRLWAQLSGADRKVKAGSYSLTAAMSGPKILAMLTSGREISNKVTVPEGADLKEIAALLEEAGLASPESLLARVVDPALVRELAPDAKTAGLEGFLFPDTYNFSPAGGIDGVLRMMAARFETVMSPELRAQAAAMGRSIHEIVTLASIIEKEAKKPADRPIIASVFYNRLKTGMALQSCATVQYALGKHKDRLLYADLQIKSPYNTYLYPGLPPGPICSPGLASLKAALYPAHNNYRYFVARPDGSHIFSRTYQEHLRAQRQIENEN